MKFSFIEIDNFLTIGEASVGLADRGLVLISGENRDDSSATSNGSGKSTISDALSWCLYGITARGASGDEVINLKAGKDCSVGVEVRDETDVWTIARFRKHKNFKNSLRVQKLEASTTGPSTWVDHSKGTDKLTQELVVKIIGCSHEVFCAAVSCGQEAMPDLPGMTDKILKSLVEQAAGTTVLEGAYEIARFKLTTAKSMADTAQKNLTVAFNEAARNLSEAENSKSEIVQFENKRLDETAAYEDRLFELRKHLHEAGAALAAMNEVNIIEGIQSAERELLGVKEEQDKERVLVKAVSVQDNIVNNLKIDLGRKKTEHADAKLHLSQAESKIGCPCSQCSKLYDASDIAPLKKKLESKVAEIVTEFNAIKSRAEAALIEHRSSQTALATFHASMTDISKTSVTLASLNAKRREIDLSKKVYEKIEIDMAATHNAKSKLLAAENPFKGQLLRIETAIVKSKEFEATCAVNYASSRADLEIMESVAKVFSPTGARGEILDEVTPFLNTQTAKYLSMLSDGNITATWTTLVKNAKGELREKFAIEVENDKGGKSFGLISGGEKRKVRISAALALQDLVSSRATKPIELFIGDEIDDALDTAGLERLVQILEEKATERGSVFIISHNDLKDHISQNINVIKEGGVSYIEETAS